MDKDLVLFLKMTSFDFNDIVHFRMLRTIYFKLTRNKVCGMVGNHWEVLGFQGSDPRTDLNRAGGVLNVIHMFYVFAKHLEIFKGAFQLAQDGEQNFPLACVCINITKMVMENLLAGKLSSLCNSGNQGVFDTTCTVFAGGFFHWYSQWRSQKRRIQDTDKTLKEVQALMEKRPAKLLEGLSKGIAELRSKTDPSRFEFTDLALGSARGPSQEGAAPPAGSQGSTKTSIPQRLRNYQQSS